MPLSVSISAQHTLSQAQQLFSSKFPHLKIEFFTTLHKTGQPSWAKYQIRDLEQTIQQAGSCVPEQTLTFTESNSAAEVEQWFQAVFHLGVQVYRRSGSVWLQTSDTDLLSLRELEQRAIERELEFTKTPPPPEEFGPETE